MKTGGVRRTCRSASMVKRGGLNGQALELDACGDLRLGPLWGAVQRAVRAVEDQEGQEHEADIAESIVDALTPGVHAADPSGPPCSRGLPHDHVLRCPTMLGLA